jgi:hypothetical protein
MPYVDPQSVHTPRPGTAPPSTWGQTVRDDLEFFNTSFPSLDAWTDYTPTLTQSGAISKTVTYARWRKLGRLLTVHGVLSATSAGTANNPIIIGMPEAFVTTLLPGGNIFWIASGAYYAVPAVLTSAGTILGIINQSAGLALGQSHTPSGGAAYDNQVASGDTIAFAFSGESNA